MMNMVFNLKFMLSMMVLVGYDDHDVYHDDYDGGAIEGSDYDACCIGD